jgi:hypothetical protein
MTNLRSTLKESEVWQRDPEDTDLWHSKHGVIVNTAALEEREFYFDVIRVASQSVHQEKYTRAYA